MKSSFGEGEVLWRANLKLHIMETEGDMNPPLERSREESFTCRGKCRDAEAGE